VKGEACVLFSAKNYREKRQARCNNGLGPLFYFIKVSLMKTTFSAKLFIVFIASLLVCVVYFLVEEFL
jgi:hypothetical protein